MEKSQPRMNANENELTRIDSEIPFSNIFSAPNDFCRTSDFAFVFMSSFFSAISMVSS